jgi:hypothetical protein
MSYYKYDSLILCIPIGDEFPEKSNKQEEAIIRRRESVQRTIDI